MLDYRQHARQAIDLFKGIKLLVLDNDGIMTPGQVHYYDSDTAVGVSYSVLDGYPIARSKKYGLHVAIISGRSNKALEHRAQILKVDENDFFAGVADKGKFLVELMQRYGLKPEEVAYMGDDFIDISAFKVVGLPISVPNRHPMVDKYVKYVTLNSGGTGAVREVCDLIMIANDTSSDMGQALQEFWHDAN
ncbi:hypothetical protein CJP74_06635 [Psittacicella melopsittaci]|uniref:3-deoxy-D-manno-octulosonate 8-phosphate phosphatase KdsC n=1 Tax=Psittacicella melopsittaci TaxID=2028576 RepID=A0A3A1Y040_9GAMM|nr:HAD hydrolase family protein [Psittacicella melopsittaci]RIY31672.1 hypothetical protein CJP74_06635 [Psittacicella melopsittaci]